MLGKLECVGESHGLLWSLGIRAYACHSRRSGILDIWLYIMLDPRMLARAVVFQLRFVHE